MKSKGNRNLTFTQRLLLEDCLKAKLHKKVIAEKLGVCLATVYNEIHRGEYVHTYNIGKDYIGERKFKHVVSYSPNMAQEKYIVNQTSKGANIKLGSDFEFVQYVENRVLKDKITPCAIIGELKKNNPFKTCVSKTTLYRYIAMGYIGNLTMKDCPMYKRKKTYKKAVAKRSSRGTSIEKRPLEIFKRCSFGHWEMDCVCGSTLATWLVLTERLSRKEIIFPMKNQTSASVIKCLNSLEKSFGKTFRKVFKSITVDNGSEFSDFQGIEKSIYKGKRTSVFYCHPYTSCERGTNERLNRDIRRLVPKGTPLGKYSLSEVKAVENWLNKYPRAVLNYSSPEEVFNNYMKCI